MTIEFPTDFTDTEPTVVLGVKAGSPNVPAKAAIGATGLLSMAAANQAAGRTAIGVESTLLSGAADPTAGDGLDGDFWLRTDTNVLFGPKADGAWPTPGTSLVGPAGPAGPAGGANTSNESISLPTGIVLDFDPDGQDIIALDHSTAGDSIIDIRGILASAEPGKRLTFISRQAHGLPFMESKPTVFRHNSSADVTDADRRLHLPRGKDVHLFPGDSITFTHQLQREATTPLTGWHCTSLSKLDANAILYDISGTGNQELMLDFTAAKNFHIMVYDDTTLKIGALRKNTNGQQGRIIVEKFGPGMSNLYWGGVTDPSVNFRTPGGTAPSAISVTGANLLQMDYFVLGEAIVSTGGVVLLTQIATNYLSYDAP